MNVYGFAPSGWLLKGVIPRYSSLIWINQTALLAPRLTPFRSQRTDVIN